jgi:hypothetical protein
MNNFAKDIPIMSDGLRLRGLKRGACDRWRRSMPARLIAQVDEVLDAGTYSYGVMFVARLDFH